MSQEGLSTEARFNFLREQSYRLAEGAFRREFPNVSLGPITDDAARMADVWSGLSQEHQRIGWSWGHKLRKFRANPRRVDVAIWDGPTLLCGMALGKVSRGRMNATIHLLQANPLRPAYLKRKIAAMAVEYLSLYAQVCECKKMMIDQPFPELMELYKSLGFTNEIWKRNELIRLWQEVYVDFKAGV